VLEIGGDKAEAAPNRYAPKDRQTNGRSFNNTIFQKGKFLL